MYSHMYKFYYIKKLQNVIYKKRNFTSKKVKIMIYIKINN